MSEITKFFVVKIKASSPLLKPCPICGSIEQTHYKGPDKPPSLFLSNHIEKVLLENASNISPCMDGDSFTLIEVVEVGPKVWPLT